jgi:hypothetical protein
MNEIWTQIGALAHDFVRVKSYSNRKAREARKEYDRKLCDLCALCG